MDYFRILKDSISLSVSSKKIKELAKNVTLKTGLFFTLWVLFVAELLRLLIFVIITPTAIQYYWVKLGVQVIDILFSLVAAGIGLLIFGYFATVIANKLFKGKGDKRTVVGVLGHSAAPFLVLALIFTAVNIAIIAFPLEETQTSEIDPFYFNEDNTSINLAPTRMTSGGLATIVQGIYFSFLNFNKALLLRLAGIIILLLAAWGALRSLFISIKGISETCKVDIIAAGAAAIVAAVPALLIKEGIIIFSYLAKYIFVLLVSLVTGITDASLFSAII